MINNKVYIIGTKYIYGNLLIYESNDYGYSWSKGVVLQKGKFHSASGAMLVKDHKIYKAIERYEGKKWGDFSAQIISIDLNKSLMNPKNWNFSKELKRNKNFSWLEGNILIGKSGEIINVMRTHFAGPDKMIALTLKNNILKPSKKLIEMPGGGSKFTIRYDNKSKKYYSIVNKQTNPKAYRNNLVLISTSDLVHFRIEKKLLYSHNMKNYAWQYVDWQFDGPDIIFVSRTAINNTQYKANNAHNANFLTFHRIKNFRNLNFDNTVLLNCNLAKGAK